MICNTGFDISYDEIMEQEARLAHKNWRQLEFSEINGIARQIEEVAKSATILRVYNNTYSLTRQRQAFESDSAHTNLVSILVDRALCYQYGISSINATQDGYTYREIMEAIRRHDLPENVSGDIPDDGTRDEEAKRQSEEVYQKIFSTNSPKRESWFEKKVLQLLEEMESKASPTGRMLYVADKAAAIIMALCYDYMGTSPIKHFGVEDITEKDRAEMDLCHFRAYGACLASEMWTVDFLKLRQITKYDDTGFFTALIVAFTLGNHKWYPWRIQDYY